jgi:dephospho-CoA kinase
MFILGLTGSIGMGKTTAGRLIAEAGIPVHDADAVVHVLYGGEAVAPIEKAFPGTTADGKVDRAKLSSRVLGDEAAMKRLEAIVHPLVRESEARFLAEQAARGARIVMVDIPLLFETGGEHRVDAIAVVSASPELQRQRVLKRPGMTAEKLEAILAKQMPDSEKRRRAHFIVDTSGDIEFTREQLHGILRAVAAVPGRAWAARSAKD